MQISIMNDDFLLFLLQTIRDNEPLEFHDLLTKLREEHTYFDLPQPHYQSSLYYLEDNKCILRYIDTENRHKGYIINPDKNCIDSYLRRREERLPAEKPANQLNKQHKKITAITIIKSCWEIISKNPLISTIVATIIAGLILKHFGI